MFPRSHFILGVAALGLGFTMSSQAAPTFVYGFEDQSTAGRTVLISFQPDGSPESVTLHKTEDFFHFVDLSSLPGTEAFGQRSLQNAHQPEDQGPGTNPFILDFGNQRVNHLSIDFGDFGGDPDDLFIKALDQHENIIKTATDVLPGGGTDFRSKTLEVNAPGIRFALFQGGPAGNNDMLYDNISYTIDENPPPASIPLPPAAYAALGAGALAFIAQRRARRTKSI